MTLRILEHVYKRTMRERTGLWWQHSVFYKEPGPHARGYLLTQRALGLLAKRKRRLGFKVFQGWRGSCPLIRGLEIIGPKCAAKTHKKVQDKSRVVVHYVVRRVRAYT